MKFIVVRVNTEEDRITVFPVVNEKGDVEFFEDRETADFERIYLQPDYDELLKVHETKLDEK
jgi:hypothetical protein